MKTREDIEGALSLERFTTYLTWTNDDHEKAVALYTRNSKISEALYIPLQMLEVALRNRIHTVMTDLHGRDWFNVPDVLLIERQRDQVKEATAALTKQDKAITPGAIVAELSFSFWTSMLNSVYEKLWQQHLHKIAKNPDGGGLSRKDIAKPLTPTRTLRNRVAHHEPILHWSLKKHHRRIMQIIEWLSPAAADWTKEHSRFDALHPEEKIITR